MRDAAPAWTERVYRKLRAVALRPQLAGYLAGMTPSNPLRGIPARVVGDASADPTEYFDHYDAFAAWAAQRIFARPGRLNTLDVGSVKLMNGVLAAAHDVTSLVLADCGDRISAVRYVRHDVADPLPFPAASFDVFTSMVSLPLVGLGRYGDRMDPNCLPRFVAELGRVMKADADLLISMCLGPNVLNFNNGWFLDMPTILRVFDGWHVVDHLVDTQSSPRTTPSDGERFSKDTSVDGIAPGDYRVVFLHFRRGGRA
jgi:hypothetical protein